MCVRKTGEGEGVPDGVGASKKNNGDKGKGRKITVRRVVWWVKQKGREAGEHRGLGAGLQAAKARNRVGRCLADGRGEGG